MGQRKRFEPWHFELRGWRQIVTFDAMMIALTALAYWVGYVHGSVPR